MSTELLKQLANIIRDDDDEMPTENDQTFDSTESDENDDDELNDESRESLKSQNYDQSDVLKLNCDNFDIEKEQAKIKLLSCYLCERVFDLKEELNAHKIEKKWTCSICSKKFCNEDDLNLHNTNEHKKIEYKCDFCGKEFDKKHNLKRHLEARNIQTCEICGLIFCNKTDIHFHKKSEHKHEKFKCDHCQKEFDKKYNLKRHCDSRTLQECHTCGSVFCNHVELTRHLSNIHNQLKRKKE